MDSKIVIFSTTPGMTKRCTEVLTKRDQLYIPVLDLTTTRALERAHGYINEGVKVFISRGGTAEYLRQNLSVPIIDIGHTFLSIFVTVKKLKKEFGKIAMIGYHNACKAIKKYNAIMNDNILVFEVNSDPEFILNFKKAVKTGAEVILGGFQISKICEEYNHPYRSTEPDESEIEKALNEASHMVLIEAERSSQYSLISTILNSTAEGIVGVDKEARVFHINGIAAKLLNYRAPCSISDLMPSDRILQTISRGADFFNELVTVNGNNLVCACQAIRGKEGLLGAVVSLQEENTIRNIDTQIRKKMLGRGHIAKTSFKDIVGTSASLAEAKRIAQRFARTNGSVLISGATGTGKELFAQGIHNFSNRRGEPFVAINCAALPQDILESELFGYVRGAFTGARSEGKAGIFELAHKGSVFLDEITEISQNVQAKLLRVLQEKEVMRIGDDKVIPVDVRIIAASNKDLRGEIAAGRFREDLYYRIGVLELSLPPLTERVDDIPLLFDHFFKGGKILSAQAEKLVKEYSWPGNIRELKNVVDRLDALCDHSTILEEDVKKAMRLPSKPNVGGISTPALEKLLPRLEERLIRETLEKHAGNRGEAAAVLGMSPTTLWRRMKKYGL
ncbi:Anaerobic nitric oxide reductase transcription regulator NorR [bioreactor metagenome]|jgi:transcriptional regulator with PAS, ATPase and Fis domain|uniref:Transcriptional regulator containing PAS, AAA-type ATPase, and DNA-binding domains n=2 Tax=root TaxID=1 RepID=A0A652ZVI1_9SPIR|nr:Transcriptional regulator containing PAS, AAA-type ATPase, and DNA-binding domains [uncultured Spirochaetota bacterium]